MRARLSLNKRRGRSKTKGKFFALSYAYTLILTGVLQRGRTIVSFRRRVGSTHHYIYNVDVDFMFASTKSLVSSKQTSSTRSILSSTTIPHFLLLLLLLLLLLFLLLRLFLLILAFFLLLFFIFFSLCYERTNASVGTDNSPSLLFLFFDDGDDSRNVVFCRIGCHFFSYLEQN